MAETSTKPYMIRALYEWCCDNGYTPYLAVSVDAHTIVPRQHVKNQEIVLNVSPMATSRLSLGNDLVEFQARFSGVAQQISIPIGNVSAIYARETGHGMAFDVSLESGEDDAQGAGDDESPDRPGGADSGQHGAEGGGARLQAVPEDGGHHTQGSTVQSLRGGSRRRGPRRLTAEDTAEDATSKLKSPHAAGGPEDVTAARTGEAGASPANARRRSARGKGSADVIAFAPSGGAAKKKAEDKEADKDAGTTGSSGKPGAGDQPAPADAPSNDGDEDPPPNHGGAGKSGKARLTRVK